MSSSSSDSDSDAPPPKPTKLPEADSDSSSSDSEDEKPLPAAVPSKSASKDDSSSSDSSDSEDEKPMPAPPAAEKKVEKSSSSSSESEKEKKKVSERERSVPKPSPAVRPAPVASPGPVQKKSTPSRGKKVVLDSSGAVKSPVAGHGKPKPKSQIRTTQNALRTATDAVDTANKHWNEFVPPSLWVSSAIEDDLADKSLDELVQLVRDEQHFRKDVEESFKEYRDSVENRLGLAQQSVTVLQSVVQNIKASADPGLEAMKKVNEELVEQLAESAKRISVLEHALEGDMDGETAAEWRKRYEVSRQLKRKAESKRMAIERRLKATEIDAERYRCQTVDLQRTLDQVKASQTVTLNDQAAHMQKAATDLLMQQAGLNPNEVDEDTRAEMATPLERKMGEWKRQQEQRWADSEKQLLKQQLSSEKSNVDRQARHIQDLTRQCDMAAKKVEEAESALEASKSSHTQLRRTMTSEQRRMKDLEHEIELKDQTKILLQNELDVANDRIRELELQLSSVRKDYFSAKRRGDALDSKFDGGGTQSEMSVLRREAAQFGGQIDELQTQVVEIKERLRKSEDQRKIAEENLRLERRKLPDVQAAIEIRQRAQDFMRTHLDRSGTQRPASVIGMAKDRPMSEEPKMKGRRSKGRDTTPMRALGQVRLRRGPSE